MRLIVARLNLVVMLRLGVALLRLVVLLRLSVALLRLVVLLRLGVGGRAVRLCVGLLSRRLIHLQLCLL